MTSIMLDLRVYDKMCVQNDTELYKYNKKNELDGILQVSSTICTMTSSIRIRVISAF